MNTLTFSTLIISVIGIWLAGGTGTSNAQQPSQDEIAQRLLSGSRSERPAALAAAREIPPSARGASLRRALMTVMDQQTREIVEAHGRGRVTELVVDPQLHARMCESVAELEDVSAIPILARGLGVCGFSVHRALAAFGERAAPAVLAVVLNPQSSYSAADEGLIALRFMVEQQAEGTPLGASTLEDIRRAAAYRLSGKQYFTTLGRAIDLAVVTGDATLRRTVTLLAQSDEAVIARGVDEPELIKRTQRIAAERLEGVAALPRR